MVLIYPEYQFNFKLRIWLSYIWAFILFVLLPVVGVWFSGKDISPYLEFPPVTKYVNHASRNFFIFVMGLISLLLILFPFIKRLFFTTPLILFKKRFQFPIWGIAGILLMIFSWLLAWGLIEGLWWLRPYYFAPLWIGFIVFVNAMTFISKGCCVMLSYPFRFITLFPVSTIFWWYFEFLNRFVQNWHYVGVERFSSGQYAVIASISFSTVLPAVVSMFEFLKEALNLKAAFNNFYRIQIRKRGLLAAFLFIFSASGMLFLGIYPDILFPIIWVSPLIILCSVQVFFNVKTIFYKLSYGDWEEVIAFCLSGLICGFFWEMWNFYSYPKWIYLIPYVSYFKIFEMPLLGYAGYLPFGLECGAIILLVLPVRFVYQDDFITP